MKMKGNTYTFVFAAIVCIVCSFTLAFVFQSLKDKQELNEALDVKKNILKAVGLKTPLPRTAKSEEILKTYREKIQELVIDEQGNIVEGKTPQDAVTQSDLHPIYIYKEGEETVAYAFPVQGKGLWSTLFGYLAIEPDGITVRGISFYLHGETPGLGAEIEKDWFQDNFKGKKIWSEEEQATRSIAVVKGRVEGRIPKDEEPFYVDGISGATMTSIGVTNLLKKWIGVYTPFFAKIRAA